MKGREGFFRLNGMRFGVQITNLQVAQAFITALSSERELGSGSYSDIRRLQLAAR